MSGDNNNNPDQLIVNADTITYRILERFNRLNELRYGRLQPLIDRLQPDQRNDPKILEVALKREMVLLGYSILRIYVVACGPPYSRRRVHLVRHSITFLIVLIMDCKPLKQKFRGLNNSLWYCD